MDYETQREIYDIKIELQNIINELSNISWGVRHDFAGIGNDKCANTISNVADHYRYVKSRVENIDTSAVTDEFMASCSGGGGGHSF